MLTRTLTLAWALGVAVAASAQSPARPMPDLVRARCVTCHGDDLIQQQRLARAGWERELDKMIRWGAVVPAAEREPLLEYFVSIGRPGAGGAAGATASGGEVFARRCLGCHGTDLVEQQRLGSAAWGREVDKMVRWGARVDPAEKDPLMAYLAGRFGPR